MLASLTVEYTGEGFLRDEVPSAPLLAAMLLVHLQHQQAYLALQRLMSFHCCGILEPSAVDWRIRGAARRSPRADAFAQLTDSGVEWGPASQASGRCLSSSCRSCRPTWPN